MRTVIAIALTLAANAVFASQVYKCKDVNGTVVFSQRPCADDPAQVETVDTSRSLKTGTGGSVEEQSEFAAMNEIRRKCAARLDGISGRYAAQRASIARQIAALEASIERTNNNLAGATAESGLRQQIGSLSVERGSLAAAEASEMQSARQQCRDEREGRGRAPSGGAEGAHEVALVTQSLRTGKIVAFSDVQKQR
ncbi:MAG: DUF4124 domain-containing protein [Rhodanobacteraceae bacterium]|nr:DUF4124 domain-containing protein [Rhodanobacteraceae bacterium]